MSAASLDPESSQSSSGYEDGLGHRVLSFDRETGEMLERLVLRPELTAFEAALELEHGQLAVTQRLDGERLDVRALDASAQHVVARRLARALELLHLHDTTRGQREVPLLQLGDAIDEKRLEVRALHE